MWAWPCAHATCAKAHSCHLCRQAQMSTLKPGHWQARLLLAAGAWGPAWSAPAPARPRRYPPCRLRQLRPGCRALAAAGSRRELLQGAAGAALVPPLMAAPPRRSRRACTGTTPWAWRASSGATRRWLRILRRWRWRPRSWTPPPAAWPTSTPRRAARPRPAGGQQGASRGPCAAPRAPHEAARSLGIGRATRCGGELLRGARPAGARAPSLDPCAPTVEPRIVLHSQARALHSQAGACAGAGVPARQAGQLIYVPVVLP